MRMADIPLCTILLEHPVHFPYTCACSSCLPYKRKLYYNTTLTYLQNDLTQNQTQTHNQTGNEVRCHHLCFLEYLV